MFCFPSAWASLTSLFSCYFPATTVRAFPLLCYAFFGKQAGFYQMH